MADQGLIKGSSLRLASGVQCTESLFRPIQQFRLGGVAHPVLKTVLDRLNHATQRQQAFRLDQAVRISASMPSKLPRRLVDGFQPVAIQAISIFRTLALDLK